MGSVRILATSMLTLLGMPFVPTIARADVFSMRSGFTSLEMVHVDHAGNAPDIRYSPSGRGAVDYSFNIGKYEITWQQYCHFLNAVAWDDPYSLHDPQMTGILDREGTPGSYSYTVADGWANRPVAYVSWGDAARFCNWLSNDQPGSGQCNAETTETGSYDLDGAMAWGELMSVARLPGSRFVLPTDDEWYKAAFFGPGQGVYYDYPTGTNYMPSNDLIAPDPGNNANFADDSGLTMGDPYYFTEVGAFGASGSPSGTFDQGGNISEWIETPILDARGRNGGSYHAGVNRLHASWIDNANPDGGGWLIGFRVAEVPEPTAAMLLAVGGILAIRGRQSRAAR